jgi:phenylpropionate dioxygenase-like ring-hydroxylating dioxygenase large terminal subunit
MHWRAQFFADLNVFGDFGNLCLALSLTFLIKYAMTESLFLKNLWYFSMHGSFLHKGKLVAKEILGERIVFGRGEDNKPFALKDNCPHRGVPLSHGWYDGKVIQCCYHGWKFDHNGTCLDIPP